MVVCDGVGEYADSSEVAENAIALARDYLSDHRVRRGYRRCAHEVDSRLDRGHEGATTLLTISADVSGHVGYSLVGNGSVIEAEGIPLGNERVQLQWTDLVLPHVSYVGGRQALRSYLPSLAGEALEVALGERIIQHETMRLFLACTDGITTDEDRRVGTVSDHSTWKEIPHPLAAVLSVLETKWIDLASTESPESELAAVVQSSLASLLAEGRLEDDATLGSVLIRPVRVESHTADTNSAAASEREGRSMPALRS